MFYKSIIILVITGFAFFSCKKENLCDCVKSTGTQLSTYRELSNFNCIYLEGKIDVYVTQGSTFTVRVDAGENLQSLIKTELDGETLKVVNNNRCNWVRDYDKKISVYITAPHFKYIENSGLGTIETIGVITQSEITCRIKNSGAIKLNLNVDRVGGSAHGNGDLYLSGITKQFFYDYVGTNYLYASELTIKEYVYLHSVTLGKSYINAPQNGLMDIIIDQAGSIYYTGNPTTIHLTKNSKGNLIKQ